MHFDLQEQADSSRATAVPTSRNHSYWNFASTLISFFSVLLLLLTILYQAQNLTLPGWLLLALVATFVVLVVVLARFLSLAYVAQHQTSGALDVTERKYESVFCNAMHAILLLDDAGICLAANPAAEDLLGLSRNQLFGRAFHQFHQDQDEFRKNWPKVLAGTLRQGETNLVTPSLTRLVEFSTTPNVLPHQHLVLLHDITDRRRAQQSLLESEQRFQQMAQNIQEIFWMMDAGTRNLLYVNRAYETITGQVRGTLQKNPQAYVEVLHRDDRARLLDRFIAASRTGKFDQRFRMINARGESRWLWARGVPVRDHSGSILRWVGTALDVTEQRRAEEQVETNLELAKEALAEAEALRHATLALTQDLRMDTVMDTLLRSLAELVPYSCARLMVAEGGSYLLAMGEKHVSATEEESSAVPFTLNSDESPFLQGIVSGRKSVLITDTQAEPGWQRFPGHQNLRSWLSVPLVASGDYLGLLSVGHTEPDRFSKTHLRRAELLAVPAAAAIQNARLYARAQVYGEELEKRITHLHQTRTALVESESTRRATEEKFQKVFRSSPIAFSITTLEDGRFMEVNTAFEHRYGYSRNELIGRTVDQLAFWEHPADRGQMVARLKKHGTIRSLVTRFRAKSGEIKCTVYSAERLQFENESCVLAVSEDVFDLQHFSS